MTADANSILPADQPVHDWYRFVLSFPPHLVRTYLDRFELPPGATLLDPFCGTGTTLVEGRLRGLRVVGVEANPAAHLASSAKIDWSPEPDALFELAERTAAEAERNQAPVGLSPEQETLLLRGSISPLPLSRILALRSALACHPATEVAATMQSPPSWAPDPESAQADFAWLPRFQPPGQLQCLPHLLTAFMRTLVHTAANLRFAPEVSVTRPKDDAPVLSAWLEAVQRIAADLRDLPRDAPPATVHLADSRDAGTVLAPGSVDAVITSPPYPNEKDYTRTTRLELVLLGFLRDRTDLRRLKQGLVRSNTRNVYAADEDDRWVADHPEIRRVAEAIEQRRVKLGKTSGFERLYHRVTRLYFGGMQRHLAGLRSALRPGARLAYVVGDQASYLQVMIRTGAILADLAGSLGYRVDGIDLFRTRLATATGEQLREEVVLLTWPG